MASLSERLLETLGHAPTAGQQRAAYALERLLESTRHQPTLVLKGYAGTGKTTLVGALVKVLARDRRPVVLLAPTGRAAKVLSAYARSPASTIHRRIYRINADEDGFGGMSVAVNKDAGALFVVDEASMIGRSGGEGGIMDSDLLVDLVQHVFSAPDCKLLLIGDPAQLPPVGSAHSPALEVPELAALGLTAGQVELTEVVRQAEASGILVNATELRALLNPQLPNSHLPNPSTTVIASKAKQQPPTTPQPPTTSQPLLPTFQPFPDVRRIDGYDLQDALETAYGRDGADEVCLICRSNKRAFEYSQQVRARIYDYEEELCPGDRLMVVKNNYYWAGRNGKPELIANGEPITVKRVHGTEEQYGLRFADITASWWNGVEERELDVKVMLDVLALPSPALPGPQLRLLGQRVMEASNARTKGLRFRAMKEDPYANALQVKYAYAVTCHKAQGGQWNTVFVDQGYVTEEMIDTEYIRWLYTAVTRASGQLYLLNFHARFWGDED
ncbi:MAG: AAA family ATPase [Flavobacteriales bacterium]|nr:AAA family ATPase [Flavobacteriales bacterium]